MRYKIPPCFRIILFSVFLLAPVSVFSNEAIVSGAKLCLKKTAQRKLLLQPPPLISAETIIPTAASTAGKLTPAIATETAQLQRNITQAVVAPPLLHLKRVYRNGGSMRILPRDQLDLYLDYAFPRASLTKIHQNVRTLQSQVDNTNNFFLTLVRDYYYRHFTMGTPHTKALFERIADMHNPGVEIKFLQRLEELVAQKTQIAEMFSKGKRSPQIRIRYIHDLDFLTAENFRPNELLISVEQRMSTSMKRGLFSYLNGGSSILIKHRPYRIYRFSGPLDHLSDFYTYLVNGDYRTHEMLLTIDYPRRALFLHNADKTVWLRVTPHEYEKPNQLHVHLHKEMPLTYFNGDHVVKDRFSLNFAIPLEKPRDWFTPEEAFKIFVQNPAQKLRTLPNVTIIEKKIK